MNNIMHKGSPAFKGFFNNDDKRIDLVLVIINKGSVRTKELRSNFLTNIIKFGLHLELDVGKMLEHRNLIFAKLHAPDAIIQEYGLFFNIRKFFKDSHVEHINLFVNPLGFNHEREIIKQLQQQYPGPVNYSTLERSKIVYNIVIRLPYGQHRTSSMGINRLKQSDIILDAFALHDGPYFLTSGQDSCVNARQTLFYNWVGMVNIWKTQPIYIIQEYLGERIALYFAFYEYFNLMLLIPGILGFLVALKHFFGKPQKLDMFSLHICHNKYLENYIICPQCRHFDLCPFRLLQSYCTEIQFNNYIDTPYSYRFGFLVYVWGIIFAILWKRRKIYLKWMWEIEGKYYENLINPEYHQQKCRSVSNHRSYLTGMTTYSFNLTMSLKWIILILLYPALFGVWLFSLFLLSTQIWYVKYWLDILYNTNALKNNRRNEHLFIAIGAAIYSILTIAMKMVAQKLSYCLTAFENHRTLGAYNFSLIIKLYGFYFTGTFALLTFHIFIGNVFYTHILDMNNWYSIAGFKVMSNRVGTSFDDIAVTLAVAVFVEQIIIKIPVFLNRKNTDYQSVLCRNAPCWEREYKLDTINDNYFHNYYNNILIQFAMSTLFSITFTLAPLLILFINLLDIRHKARTILLTYRRPLLHNISGPRIWHKLFFITAVVVPIFKICIIGLQSRRFTVEHAITTPQFGHLSTLRDDPRYPFNWFYQTTDKQRFEKFNSSLGEPSPKEEYKKLPSGSGHVCNITAQEHFFYNNNASEFYAEFRWHHSFAIRYEFVLLYSIISLMINLLIYFHFPISTDIEDTLNTETRIKQKYYMQKGFMPNDV